MYFVWLIYMLSSKSQTTSVSFWVSELFSREYASTVSRGCQREREAKSNRFSLSGSQPRRTKKSLEGTLALRL